MVFPYQQPNHDIEVPIVIYLLDYIRDDLPRNKTQIVLSMKFLLWFD